MSQTEDFRPPVPGKRTINVRVTIDTDPMPRPAEGPGDAAEPTSIDQDLGHMVVTASHGVENQGTGDVAFEARAGDVLRFFISSGSNNFEQGVLLEDVRHAGGGEILTDFKYQAVEQTAVVPQSPTDVQLVQKQFQFYQCVVASHGTGSYDLVFALYDRNEEGQPSLTSHYRWAMQLTAHSNRREP